MQPEHRRYPTRKSSLSPGSVPVTPITASFNRSSDLSSSTASVDASGSTPEDHHTETQSAAETGVSDVAGLQDQRTSWMYRASKILDLNIEKLLEEVNDEQRYDPYHIDLEAGNWHQCSAQAPDPHRQRRDTLTSSSSRIKHDTWASDVQPPLAEEPESPLPPSLADDDDEEPWPPATTSRTSDFTLNSSFVLNPSDTSIRSSPMAANRSRDQSGEKKPEWNAQSGLVYSEGNPPTDHVLSALYHGLGKGKVAVVREEGVEGDTDTIGFYGKGDRHAGTAILTCSLVDWKSFLAWRNFEDPSETQLQLDKSSSQRSSFSSVEDDHDAESEQPVTRSKMTKLSMVERLRRKSRWGNTVSATAKPYSPA